MNPTKNFNPKEFYCKCNYKDCIKLPETQQIQDHINRLQEMRDYCNKSMKINSGYRCPKHNTDTPNSSKNSVHMTGCATDIAIPQEIMKSTPQRKYEWCINMRAQWLKICARDGLGGGFGIYDTFIHMDSRKLKSTWDLRTKK